MKRVDWRCGRGLHENKSGFGPVAGRCSGDISGGDSGAVARLDADSGWTVFKEIQGLEFWVSGVGRVVGE